MIEELGAQDNNATSRCYTWQPEGVGLDVPLSAFDLAENKTYFYHTDANKNVTELTDCEGAVVAHYEYSPFGMVTKLSGDYAATNPFRFSSEYYDSEIGLVYYNYRYYDPQLGRWLSRDSIKEDGGWNLYCFIFNDILNYFDINGTASWKPVSGTNAFYRGPEKHTPKGRTHYHVKGYNRQILPDGTQIPHGEGGQNKDVPKKIIDALKKIMPCAPVPVTPAPPEENNQRHGENEPPYSGRSGRHPEEWPRMDSDPNKL